RDNGDQSEARRLEKLTHPELDVLHQRFEPHCPAASPAVLFDLIDAAKLDASEPACLALRDTGSHFIGDLRIEVESEFLVEIDLQALAGEWSPEQAHEIPSSFPLRMRPTTSVRRFQFSFSVLTCA